MTPIIARRFVPAIVAPALQQTRIMSSTLHHSRISKNSFQIILHPIFHRFS
jgi:hypothetical protein